MLFYADGYPDIMSVVHIYHLSIVCLPIAIWLVLFDSTGALL